MQRSIKILVSAILIAGLAFLLAFTEKRYHSSKVKGLDFQIQLAGPDTIILEKEVRDLVLRKFDSLEGEKVAKVNLEGIENLIDSIAWLEYTDASITVTGKLRVNSRQKVPVARIMTSGNGNFYVDRMGNVLPEKINFPAYVPVLTFDRITIPANQVTGLKELDEPVLTEALDFILKLREDEFMNSMVDQVHVNSDGKYELVPKIGGHVIKFGNTERMNEKFENLLHIYKIVLPAKGWDYYSAINLEYEKQVVCIK